MNVIHLFNATRNRIHSISAKLMLGGCFQDAEMSRNIFMQGEFLIRIKHDPFMQSRPRQKLPLEMKSVIKMPLEFRRKLIRSSHHYYHSPRIYFHPAITYIEPIGIDNISLFPHNKSVLNTNYII